MFSKSRPDSPLILKDMTSGLIRVEAAVWAFKQMEDSRIFILWNSFINNEHFCGSQLVRLAVRSHGKLLPGR